MKKLSTSSLLLTLSLGISISVVSSALAQQHETFGDSAPADLWGADVVSTFSVEPQPPVSNMPASDDLAPKYQSESAYQPEPSYQARASQPPETVGCQTCEGDVVTDENLFPEVKNANFFGVDRDECCDEWAGMCKGKSLKYGCGCGGLKANKGHLGIPWLKRKYGGDGCDYCKGGCCEKGCNGKKCSAMKDCLKKCCFLKNCLKDDAEESSDCQPQSDEPSIFGRPLDGNDDRCGCRGCREKGCSPDEKCGSCK